jgi:glycerol-3-phosphate dehydrogenase
MTEGKRILFAIPWGQRVILGTTDTDYNGSLDDVRVEQADVRYVLDITNQHFPEVSLTTKDVISSWAGLRPLIADPHGKPSDISRSHQIRNPEVGWWDVAGGKLTTYRLMAEQTVDQIVKILSGLQPSKGKIPACRTANEPLLSPAETDRLSGILPPEFNRDIVAHFCANEWAIHLDDVMLRRTRWHYYLPNATQMAEQVADWMSEILGWPETTRTAELRRYFHAVNFFEGSEGSHLRGTPEIAGNRRVHDEAHR